MFRERKVEDVDESEVLYRTNDGKWILSRHSWCNQCGWSEVSDEEFTPQMATVWLLLEGHDPKDQHPAQQVT
jgi:hypothetical protein